VLDRIQSRGATVDIVGRYKVSLPVALVYGLVACTRLVRLSGPVLPLLAAQDQTVDNERTIKAFRSFPADGGVPTHNLQ
jgi:hypothetical protein